MKVCITELGTHTGITRFLVTASEVFDILNLKVNQSDMLITRVTLSMQEYIYVNLTFKPTLL